MLPCMLQAFAPGAFELKLLGFSKCRSLMDSSEILIAKEDIR